MASPSLRPAAPRSPSLVLGLLGASLAIAACGNSVVHFDTGGGGGEGGSSTTSATTTDPATTSATTTETPTATDTPTTTDPQGGGGTGGAMTGGGGAGGGVVDPWAGPVESLKELDVGAVEFGAQAQFPIPDKTLGFTVQAEGDTLESIVGIYRLRPPVGSSVIINFAMTGHETQVFGGQGFIAAADPQADSFDAYPVKAGAWKVTLGSDGESGTGADVRVWVRRTGDGQFHGGAMDVNLFVVPGVASATYLNQVLNAFFPYAGIEKGTVTTYTTSSVYSTVNSRDEYRAMLGESAGLASAPAVNLFVVDNFSNEAFGGAIGVAGGIPGSPMRHGTTQSGVAFEPSGDPGYDATVLMHEIGHLGGLFHTTEFQIVETDSLSDTPVCPEATIANNPGQCPDKDNVMFPIAYGATAFTTAQLNVLHGSALYRGILEQGGVPSGPLAIVAPPGAPGLMPFVDDPSVAFTPRSMPRSPDPLERVLGALWCAGDAEALALSVARDAAVRLSRDPHPTTAASPGRTAPSASSRLRAIVLDDARPVLLRKRALNLYMRAAHDEGIAPQAIETVLAIARRTAPAASADRRLRSAALRLLRDVSHAPATGLRASLAAQHLTRIDAALAAALTSPDALLAAAASGQ